MDFPHEKHVATGGILVIKCDARGDQPLQYQWFKNNRLLAYSHRHELVIERVGVEHGGQYVCNVSNRFGDKLSPTCRVIGTSLCVCVFVCVCMCMCMCMCMYVYMCAGVYVP